MFLVQIICSDAECAEELEVEVESLDELDHYACDCGHGFVLITVSEHRESGGSGVVVSLPKRDRAASRRAA